ncbi:class I SAM-dependent methyltransferase [Gracilimonas halophila]|uniref:Class I SAM-dependent methyltransferase n=1 Tax=Gracilimonas halophila TaxID=1834464 RepID=A0ABW5JM34_9BACT
MEPSELSSQLRKPTGETGKEIGKALNESNQKLYELAFEMMELRENDTVLEVGFGNGIHFPEYFRIQPRLSIAGVDFSKEMCEEAKAHNPKLIASQKLSLHCEETSALPFPDDRFDLAVALNVIYFLDPPEIHLREIRRVLKPNGQFLIGYRPRHAVEHLEFTKQNFILYERDELESLFKENGFGIIEDTTRTYEKLSLDKSRVTVTDACLLVQKV